MHADILRVTRAIEERSKDLRDDYLSDVDAMRLGAPDRKQLSCGNLAHGMAACSSDDKSVIKLMEAANNLLQAGEFGIYNESQKEIEASVAEAEEAEAD